MKYEVTYKCGHEGKVDLGGKEVERERRLAWLATCECPECYAARKAQELATREESHEMPELSGSEKQVAWAKKIRNEQVKEWERVNARSYVWAWAQSKTEASFWIDNRNEAQLANKYIEEIKAIKEAQEKKSEEAKVEVEEVKNEVEVVETTNNENKKEEGTETMEKTEKTITATVELNDAPDVVVTWSFDLIERRPLQDTNLDAYELVKLAEKIGHSFGTNLICDVEPVMCYQKGEQQNYKYYIVRYIDDNMLAEFIEDGKRDNPLHYFRDNGVRIRPIAIRK